MALAIINPSVPETREQYIEWVKAHPVYSINPLRRFFDFDKAMEQVLNRRLAKTTREAYSRDLPIFIAFLDANEYALPSPEIMRAYMSAMNHLKASTIYRYLAPVRKFCQYIYEQTVSFDDVLDGREMFNLSEARQAIHAAINTEGPPKDEVNYDSPLMQHGTRLRLNQVNNLLESIDKKQLIGVRDYALMVLGFNAMLRISEIGRVTLESFQTTDDPETMTVNVVGKRNNTTPVPCPRHAFEAVQAWVSTYNSQVPAFMQIQSNEPVWRALKARSGEVWDDPKKASRFKKDKNGVMRPVGITSKSLSVAIIKRVKHYDSSIKFTSHDMRRTGAYLAYMSGFTIKQIQIMLRHKSPVTTQRYIGEILQFEQSNIAKKVKMGLSTISPKAWQRDYYVSQLHDQLRKVGKDATTDVLKAFVDSYSPKMEKDQVMTLISNLVAAAA